MIKGSKSWVMMGAAALALTGMGGYLAGHDALAAPVNPAPTPAPASVAPHSFADLVQKVAPAVVSIDIVGKAKPVALQGGNPFGEDSPFGPELRRFFNLPRGQGQGQGDDQGPGPAEPLRAAGSGFFISADGYILTNNHVVENADEITVKTKDDRELKAKLIGRDPATDLAVIKVEGAHFPYVSFEDRAKPRVGDWVIAVGNPFGLGGTATAGIVSAMNRRNVGQSNYVDFMQIDAPINRGNSGGPTFDIDGRVVGVNTAIFSPSGGSVGIGFAIPADVADAVTKQLIAGGKVTRGYMGATIQNVTPEIADSLGIGGRKGALVAEVVPGQPADKAGLQPGDVVLSLNGKSVGNSSELTRLVAQSHAGDTLRLEVLRNGKPATIDIHSGTRPSERELARADNDNNDDDSDAAPQGGPVQPRPSALGMSFGPLDESAQRRYAIPSNLHGVVVESVQASSDAGQKGLKRGDVIVRAGDRDAVSPADVLAAVDQAKRAGRTSVLLQIHRGGRNLFVPIKIQP
jgi:serine protease Do